MHASSESVHSSRQLITLMVFTRCEMMTYPSSMPPLTWGSQERQIFELDWPPSWSSYTIRRNQPPEPFWTTFFLRNGYHSTEYWGVPFYILWREFSEATVKTHVLNWRALQSVLRHEAASCAKDSPVRNRSFGLRKRLRSFETALWATGLHPAVANLNQPARKLSIMSVVLRVCFPCWIRILYHDVRYHISICKNIKIK